MGASSSRESPTQNVFEKELRGINDIVNKIVSNDNTFINKEYNFLSSDVCNKYQIVLESELSKHLKVHLAEFGSNIYVIPKDDAPTHTKMTKARICESISNHYVSILYILCLIKYVYNLENNGDRSFGGIIFRNVKIVNNMMQVMFCNTDQKEVGTKSVNLSNLDGFKFFTKFFLSKDESKSFMKLMRAILGRKNKSIVKTAICEAVQNKSLTAQEANMLAVLYERNYGEAFSCKKATKVADVASEEVNTVKREREIDTSIFIQKGNPVFLKNYCNVIDNHSVDITTKEGRVVKNQYDIMIKNYKKNIDEVHTILQKLVTRQSNGNYTLVDIDGETLKHIIHITKQAVRKFFLQSILDYQHLLDLAKNTPNVKLSIKTNEFF